MTTFLSIAFGASLGAYSRFLVAQYVAGHTFPYGTMMVNLVGCFLMGCCWSLFHHLNISDMGRLMIITGFLGAFTTFSAFGYDCWQFITNGQFKLLITYMFISNIGGIMALILGVASIRFGTYLFR